jgi:hypothetical protein
MMVNLAIHAWEMTDIRFAFESSTWVLPKRSEETEIEINHKKDTTVKIVFSPDCIIFK